MSNTAKNHYVPRGYLKFFFGTENSIYRLDKTTGDIREFIGIKSVEILAMGKDLYTVTTPISEKDIIFYKRMFDIPELTKAHEDILNLIVNFMNNDLFSIFPKFTLKNKVDGTRNEEAQKIIDNYLTKTFAHIGPARMQEDLCTLHEKQFYKVRNEIIQHKNLGCIYPIEDKFKDPIFFKYIQLYSYIWQGLIKDAYAELVAKYGISTPSPAPIPNAPYFDLFYYVIFQYFRCPYFFNTFQNDDKAMILKTKHGVDIKNVQFLFLQHKTLDLLSKWHFDGMKPILIINNTKTHFITSDRPSINIYGKFLDTQSLIYTKGAFELFFPLSNEIALLYSERNCYKDIDVLTETDASKIEIWNKIIFENADRWVFASQNNFYDLI